MNGSNGCWICKSPLAKGPSLRPGTDDVLIVDCDLCGKYSVTTYVEAMAFPLPENERFRLSHWVKQRTLDQDPQPLFDVNTTAQVVASLVRYEPSDKLDVLLVSLSKLVKHAGAWLKIDSYRMYSLACASEPDEFLYYVDALQRLGHLRPYNDVNPHLFQITPTGWQRIDHLRSSPLESRRAFVALRFLPDMLGIYQTVMAPSIERAGYRPERSGTPTHNDRIDARIMVQIKTARFVVADVTHDNQGVYFEAGYAIGLGRPVIWTCRKDWESRMHFDTRQYNHIIWETPEQLDADLYDRVVATI